MQEAKQASVRSAYRSRGVAGAVCNVQQGIMLVIQHPPDTQSLRKPQKELKGVEGGAKNARCTSLGFIEIYKKMRMGNGVLVKHSGGQRHNASVAVFITFTFHQS